jgi:hypothetical protein
VGLVIGIPGIVVVAPTSSCNRLHRRAIVRSCCRVIVPSRQAIVRSCEVMKSPKNFMRLVVLNHRVAQAAPKKRRKQGMGSLNRCLKPWPVMRSLYPIAARAYRQEGYVPVAETYLRLALKAQSQSRASIESLTQIKNPPVVYARQANFANGPQQVNNGGPQMARTRENEIPPSKQSGNEYELLPDDRASAPASGIDSTLEAVGTINRTTNGRG